MRIVILATGSRGDVEPYVALGEGLLRAGHVVRLVTHEDFEAVVQSHGLEFWPIAGKVQAIVQAPEMRGRLEGGSFLAVMAQMAKEAQRGALALAEVGLAACQGADLVLAGLGGLFVGTALAEKLGLPIVQAYYIPLTPTSAYPSFLARWLPPWAGGWAKRLSFRVARQVLWQGFRPGDKVAREQVLGMPAASFWGPWQSQLLRKSPILYGYSPAVIPKPPDWGSDVHVTGYWFLDPVDDWMPAPELASFLEDGPPPIYVGFGSMSSRNPEETADIVFQALAQSRQRAVVLSGWGGLQPEHIPDSVFVVESVPFSWLFPRMAAVVHHGGAGTTAAGLRAGVPSLVVPFFGDQPYWGQRVAELGAGPKPIPRKKLTADRLAQAISQAVTDGVMRRRAADLGARIRAE
ncbi:MAG: glycosyltransferase, partial [Anaerolineae bacterium]